MRLEKAMLRPFLGFRSVLGWYRWQRDRRSTLYGRNGLSVPDRIWCVSHGFRASQFKNFRDRGLKENYRDYLSMKDYYRLHPLNGEYSFWVDDKLTMKYVFSKFDEYLPRYYFQIEKDRVMRLYDCPEGFSADEDGMTALLKEKKALALKRLWGACGAGFYKLEYRDGQILINSKVSTEEELKQTFRECRSYLLMEYIVNHKRLREVWPDATNTIRVLMANTGGEITLMRSFIRFGNAKSGHVDNARRGGIEGIIDEETGKILYAETTDKTGRLIPITNHPDSGASFDFTIPDWDRIVSVTRAICESYPELSYLGFDVALTDDGFRIIEINSLSGLVAAQSRCPLLKDPKTRKIYESFGLKL